MTTDNITLKQISDLLDEKLKENNKVIRNEINAAIEVMNKNLRISAEVIEKGIEAINKKQKDRIVIDLREIIERAFDRIEARTNTVQEEVEKRPTKNEIFQWADKKIDDIDLKVDRLDYLHIKELKNLPAQYEISHALVEADLK